MSFAKKDFYPTPSSVLITNCELNGPSSYLRQSGTYMIVDEEEVIQESFDVNSLYHEEGSTL
tara:strand:- start:839 stop:1024 length:186 start_codon:yes stop_codon:yes gene_type:complete